MARKKKTLPDETKPINIEETAGSLPGIEREASEGFQPYTPSDDSKAKAKPRLSFGLSENGTIDMEGTRAETLQRVKDFFNDPRNRELLGQNVQVEEIISEQDVAMLFDGIGTVEAYIFNMAGKIDMDIAQKHALFTPEQKKMVVPPTQRIIAKNAGKLAWALQWKDEIALAGIMLVLSRAKFDGAKKEMAARVEAKRQFEQGQNPALQKREIPNMGLDTLSSEIAKN